MQLLQEKMLFSSDIEKQERSKFFASCIFGTVYGVYLDFDFSAIICFITEDLQFLYICLYFMDQIILIKCTWFHKGYAHGKISSRNEVSTCPSLLIFNPGRNWSQ